MKKQTVFLFLVVLGLSSCLNSNPEQDTRIEPDGNVSTIEKAEEVRPETTSAGEDPRSEAKELLPSNFMEVMEGLEIKTYQLKKYSEEENFEEVFLNTAIDRVNRYRKKDEPEISKIDTKDIIMVRKAFVKSTEDMGGNLYPRADIESWEFRTKAAADVIMKAVEGLRDGPGHTWEDISKSPISVLQADNELVFITPGGFYMLDKVGEIKTYIKDNLQ